jgi:hypothetical protein
VGFGSGAVPSLCKKEIENLMNVPANKPNPDIHCDVEEYLKLIPKEALSFHLKSGATSCRLE